MSTPSDSPPRQVRGIIFDLDGTLVDSALDFDAMRREMRLAAGLPLLEALAEMPPDEAARCREILHRHERAGGERAVLMPGVVDFLARLDAAGVRRAVWTRNSRQVALDTLERLALTFERVVAREDAPAKPDQSAVAEICRHWRLDSRQLAVIGDYVFDLEAGRRAGTHTVLYTAGLPAHQCEGHEIADFHLPCFTAADDLVRWLGL
jgi:HAD superfamily hydrolase (TIGR01509 family)